MKLSIGTIAGGPQFIFRGALNWLVGLDRGRLFASTDGIRFSWLPFRLFGSSNINVVKSFNNEFWVGGDQGKVAKSTNGTDWTTVTTGFTNNVISIKYGEKQKENNPISWTTVAINFGEGSGSATSTEDVIYGNGRWFAVLSNGTRFSDNLIDWKAGRQRTSSSFRDVIYANNKFYTNDFTSSNIYESTDAIFWTTTISLGESINFLSYGNGIWIAVGYAISRIRTSTDTINWVTRSIPNQFSTLVYGNGVWVAGGGTRLIYTSNDTITWTSRASNFISTNTVNGLAYGNGIFIAAANSTGSTIPGVRRSTDGITWTTVSNSLGIQLSQRELLYGNGMWFGIEAIKDSVVRSTDGTNWQKININTIDSTLTLESIAYGNNFWLFGTNKNYLMINSNYSQSYAVGVE